MFKILGHWKGSSQSRDLFVEMGIKRAVSREKSKFIFWRENSNSRGGGGGGGRSALDLCATDLSRFQGAEGLSTSGRKPACLRDRSLPVADLVGELDGEKRVAGSLVVRLS